MKTRLIHVCAAFVLAAFLVVPAASAQAPAPQGQQAPPTLEQVMQRQWNNVTGKVIAMAKDLPEDKWDSRPHKDSRSALQEFWHCMASMQFAAARVKGQQMDRAATDKLFADEGKPRNRAEIVAAMESAAKEFSDTIGAKADPRFISGIEHMGEHYGKLVTIYRMNGIVPPASRKGGE